MNTNSIISRRDFLRIMAVGGIAVATAKFGLENLAVNKMVAETALLMGTLVNIRLVHNDPALSRKAIAACFDRMRNLENILSRFKPNSQLSLLNRHGSLANADEPLVALVEQSVILGQLTGGAFDITILPLLSLYQAVPRTLPSISQIDRSLELVDFRKIKWDKKSVVFDKSGMSITLDGIAKGYIIDEGIKILRQYGFENILLEAGGDLVGKGERKPHDPWMIGVQSPRDEMSTLMTSLHVQDQGLATSGDYMQAYTPDYAYHHIIDPRLGRSSPDLASVSVIAPSCAQADGLATALMVMGKKGIRVVEALPDCEALLVTKDLSILKTSGL